MRTFRYFAAFEYQFRGIAASHTDFVQFGSRVESFHSLLYNEGGDTFGSLLRGSLCVYHQGIRDWAVCNPSPNRYLESGSVLF